MTEEDAQAVIQSRGNELAKKLLGVIRGTLARAVEEKVGASVPSVIAMTPSQLAAQNIVGDNFLRVEDVAACFKARFTEEQLAALADVPFDEAKLQACKDTHILFPGFPVTILQIRSRMPKGAFRSYKDAWYNGEDFARKDKVEARWYLLRKDAVPNSFGKYYNDQRALLSASETVPRACEVVFGTMLFFAVRGVKLFQTYYVRTVSLSGAGVRFGVGYFGGFGLGSHSWHDNAYYDVGLASSVKALC
jgi:hypothetical protein